MPVPGNGTTVAVSRRLLVDDVYDRILGAIYAGQLAPGEKLNDSELCAWLGTSRTPIRQALARLETQGLVETAANRWTRVTPIDAQRYRKSIPVVASLYRVAAQDATEQMTQTELTDLSVAMQAVTTALQIKEQESLVESALNASEMMALLANNPVLTEALNTVMPRIRRVNAIYTKELDQNLIGDMLRIALNAMASGSPDEAGEAWYLLFDQTGRGVADLLDADTAMGRYN